MQIQSGADRLNDRECLRSFVIASAARQFIVKNEVLMGAHITGAALFTHPAFKFYLHENAPGLLASTRQSVREITRGKALQKFTLSPALYETLHSDAVLSLRNLAPYAQEFDRGNPAHVSIKDMILTGIEFLQTENAAYSGLNETGNVSLNYINPFTTMRACTQVGTELLKTISEDVYPRDKCIKAIEGLNRNVSSIYRKYPIGLTIREASTAQKATVLEDMSALIAVLRLQRENIMENTGLDPVLRPIILKGLQTVEHYLEPFTLPLPKESFDAEGNAAFSSNIIPYGKRKKELADTFHAKPTGPEIL